MNYAPDGVDECVDNVVMHLVTTTESNTTLSSSKTVESLYSVVRGVDDATLNVVSSTEFSVSGDLAEVVDETSVVAKPALVGCGLGSTLDSIVIRTEAEQRIQIHSLSVEYKGSRWTATVPQRTILSTVETHGAALVHTFSLALDIAGLKGATVMLLTGMCSLDWTVAGSLYFTLYGSGVDGQSTVTSEEYLFGEFFTCGRSDLRVFGVDPSLGDLAAIKVHLVAPTKSTLPVADIQISYGGKEYSTNLGMEIEMHDWEMYLSLAVLEECVEPAWVTLETLPFGGDGIPVAVLGSLIGSKSDSTERPLATSLHRGALELSRVPFECDLGQLLSITVRAEDTWAIQLNSLTIRYDGAQYKARVDAPPWLSTDLSQGIAQVELELIESQPAARIDGKDDTDDSHSGGAGFGVAITMAVVVVRKSSPPYSTISAD